MTHSTTCQICGRPIKTRKGMIAHHGYRRPGDGWQTASCWGTHAEPYEISADRIKLAITRLEESIVKTEELLADLETNPPAKITGYIKDRGGWGHTRAVEYERPADFTPAAYDAIPRTYANEYGNKRRGFQQSIEGAKGQLAYLRERLAAWKPAAE